jgi:predicted dehydrogenase
MHRISRRRALAGAAAPLVVPASTAFSYQANSKISFGVIGTGGRGRYVATLMTRDARARLGAICDILPDRIDLGKTQIPGADQVKAYRDYRQLLADPAIDAVLIATPVFLHPEHFEAAVKAGKHVYCEKPAGVDVAGVKRLLRAGLAAPKSQSIAFGFQQRFSPEYLAAEKILRDPEKFGDLTLMISYWIWGGAPYRGEGNTERKPLPGSEEERIRRWHSFRETSGDFLVEQDCHGVDVLNWFAAAHPLRASGDGGRKARKAGNTNDHALVTYTYPNELKGWLLGTQLPHNGYWDVKEQFFGTRGSLETERSYYRYTPMGQKQTASQPVRSKREITIDAVEAFFQSIADAKPLHMTQDAADSTLTAILARMAVDLKREVTWDEMMKSAD